jgi:phage tail-like protein
VAGDERGGGWPLPKFYFAVDIDGVGTDLPFQEVSGLDTETQAIEYRSGQGRNFSTVKLPGIGEYGNVTLKKGIFAKDNRFFDWLRTIERNTIERANVTIRLLDENGNPTMAWTLTNAWPTKFSGTDFQAEGNEVAVDTIELAHEGLTIANR